MISGQSNMSFLFGSQKWKDKNDNGTDGSGAQIGLTLGGGYFVINNLVIGLQIPLSYTFMKDDASKDKESITSIIFEPSVRYYFLKGKFKPFVHGGIGYGSAKYKYDPSEGSSETDNYSQFVWEVGGGCAFFVTNNVSIDLLLAYSSTTSKAKKDNPDDYRTITSGMGGGIGLTILF
jgi:opacity protein-like surface antigen